MTAAFRTGTVGLLVLLVSMTFLPSYGQVLDDHGILRWEGTGEEVCAFGVNYTLPFAHAWRAAGYLQQDRETAIRQDVYHMARLGLDGFRVHVWDCEISDTLGNLIENEHLRLLDYLLMVMQQSGIRAVITPIAYWGNGYPERDENTPGFSTKYGKAGCLTDPAAIRAQERYLEQFVSHVNPYTGLALKDDPGIIAFEICNEPHHAGTIEETRLFINRMADAIRSTGCMKPVFYNASHSTHLAEAYYSARIQGGTFQWYPSGLVAGHEMKGNFLPNVTAYPIPFDTVPGFGQMARIVYEYDPADIDGSHLHPYMAKSFREAGFQFAAQFSYDPMFMAFVNTEYQTHYMNLACTPRKALSLMIAAEVFRHMPLGEESGNYPSDTLFGLFRVSYQNDLSEMVSDKQFIHSNHTLAVPPHPELLRQVAGYGSSPLISYGGQGAYFLDRLEEGVWRLEVMPDAVRVKDPHERASLRKPVTVVIHREHSMKIALPDLGNDFSVTGLNDGNSMIIQAIDNQFEVRPGTYLLARKGIHPRISGADPWKGTVMGTFVAPAGSCHHTYLLHEPPEEIPEGRSLKLRAECVSADAPANVELYLYRGWRPVRVQMKQAGAYGWEAEIPEEMIRRGFLRYHIVVHGAETTRTYPPGVEGLPTDWDFYHREAYSIPVVEPESPLVLFDAEKDAGGMFGNARLVTMPSSSPGGTVVEMRSADPARASHGVAARFFFRDKIAGRIHQVDRFSELVLCGSCSGNRPVQARLSLVMNDGTTYGGLIRLGPGKTHHSLKLEELRLQRTLILPGSYPGFLPFYAEGNFTRPFDIRHAESVQVEIGPGSAETGEGGVPIPAIEKIYLK